MSNYLGDYRLIAKLGRGRTTDIFLALHEAAGGVHELCVVKRVREDTVPAAANPQAVQLQHPNIVRTLAVVNDVSLPYRALEYIDGQPLARVLTAGEEFAASWALHVAGSLLTALVYAQGAWSQRDLDARDVFVTYQGEIKLGGFDRPQPRAGREVYAVGVIMWQLLTRGSGAPESAPMPPLAAVRPSVHPTIAAICDRALDQDVEASYPSAAAMLADIDAYLETHPGMRNAQPQLASFTQRAFASEARARERHIAELTAGLPVAQPPLTLPPPIPQRASTLPPPLPASVEAEPVHAEAATWPPPFPERQMTLLPPPLRERRDTDPTPTAVLLRDQAPPSVAPRPRVDTRLAGLAALALALLACVGGWYWLRTRTTPTLVTAAPIPAPPTAPAPAPETVLRLCGSNTIGDELAPTLVAAFLAAKGGTDTHTQRDPQSGLTHVLAQLGPKQVSVEIQAHGSATAFSGLADGSCDVGMASRAIDETEAAKLAASGLGDARSAGAEHVIALDGIAVIVHPNNPVHALDRATLHDVFTGKLKDWSEVGGSRGSPTAIHVLARDAKSGTFDTFKQLVLGQDALDSTAQRFEQSAALSDQVARDPGAIGFVGLAYVRSAKALAVSEAKTTAMLPTRFTVATEGYMLSRRLYLYTAPKPQAPWATELVSFAISRHGQEAVAKAEFIDLSLMTRDMPCDEHCPARYAATVASAQRVSVDFRFRPGSNEPDSRADRDIERFMTFLGDRRSAKVLLLGFSDGVGSMSANEKLSLERARAIERELELRGVRSSVVAGFGEDMPVASNESDSARQRNRRVEVWVKD